MFVNQRQVLQMSAVIRFMLYLPMLIADAKVIDLTHTLKSSTYAHGGIPHYNRTAFFYGEMAGGIFVDHGAMIVPEHAGTHMDAPSHFVKNGPTLEDLTLKDCIADGVMIDCSEEASNDREYSVPVQKLVDWEEEHGRIPDRAAVVFNFDWSKKFTTPTEYAGSSELSNFMTFKIPSVSPEAARWLQNERDIKIIATDTLTPDPFVPKDPQGAVFPIHVEYLREKRLLLENVKDTGKLPTRGFRFYAVPYKFDEASGAPTRTFAITYDEVPSATSSAVPCSLFTALMLCVSLFVI